MGANGGRRLRGALASSDPGEQSVVDGSHLQSTRSLVLRIRDGDLDAREELMERALPLLRRWARGRVPGRTRGLVDTDDIVQVTVMRALASLDRFEERGSGSFLAYARQIALNALRDEIRRSGRRPELAPLDADGLERAMDEIVSDFPRATLPGPGDAPSLIDYERALDLLPQPKRQAVILRLDRTDLSGDRRRAGLLLCRRGAALRVGPARRRRCFGGLVPGG